jgi:hypothetical protein
MLTHNKIYETLPAMRIIETTSTQWNVLVQMRGVLLKAGAECKAGQEASRGNAGGHRAISGQPWPGSHLGIRAPGIDETPLSLDECWIAVRNGL